MSKLAYLTKKRRDHVKSCRTNKDKSHEIISNLYSSRTHCIYELLQNADDAKATEATFTLSSDALEFRHNGKELFSWDDVDAITAVGISPKQDDVNAIGKFGAGFKSVFSVTKTPIIHSGVYHFRIVDFIVPEKIEDGHDIEKDTVINLPFNHPNAPKKETYNHLAKGLESLESESLLFLHNIKIIQWQTLSVKGRCTLESGESGERTLVMNVDGEEVRKNYLLFSEAVDIDDIPLKLSVAYRMSDDKKMIIAEEDAKLFVYFPTKERPMLNFLVHAPYKTTPNRETIPLEDDQQNKDITRALTELIAESIRSIKGKGLLNAAFLSLLPIDKNNTHPIYAEAFEKVKNILLSEALLPTVKKGEYTVVADALLAREKNLTGLLGASDCACLFAKKFWIEAEITGDKMPELRHYLMTHLSIPEINIEKFCQHINERFIKTKTDTWLVDFYAVIADSVTLYRKGSSYQHKGILREKPIIRLDDGAHVCPENEHEELQVYLPTGRKSEFKTVKKSVASDERARVFLQKLGVGKPDDVAEIKEFIVPKYQNDATEVTRKEYMDDFRRVFEIWSNSSDAEKSDIVNMLSKVNFIGAIDCEKSFSLRKPHDIYHTNDKLQMWFEGNDADEIYFLADCMVAKKEHATLLKDFKMHNEPKIWGNKHYHTRQYYHVKGLGGFNPEFKIEGLEFSLTHINKKRSFYIFNLALRHANKLYGEIHECSRQNFEGGSHNEKRWKYSISGEWLFNNHWLYDQNDSLIEMPLSEISMDDLHADYDTEHENIDKLVKVLGLKSDLVKQLEERTGKVVLIVTPEEAAKFKKLLLDRDVREKSKPAESWIPKTTAEEAPIDEQPLNDTVRDRKDRSGQSVNEGATSEWTNNTESNKKVQSDVNALDDNTKEIGEWGEKYAQRYLIREHGDAQLIWLNEKGNKGEGYDFVVRKNEQDICYYEVKSKTDDSPTLFQVTGTQWSWATKLHDKGKGDMYRILLVSGAGGERPNIKQLKDPVALWKSGRIYADPVKIELN